MIPTDVKIPVELQVYCTKKELGKPFKLSSAELECNGLLCDISDILSESQSSELCDKWGMLNIHGLEWVEHEIEFEVIFDSDGEIDNVSLNCHDINDILSDEILGQLKSQAKANYIQERIDRGER
jgi:hypothetical protein